MMGCWGGGSKVQVECTTVLLAMYRLMKKPPLTRLRGHGPCMSGHVMGPLLCRAHETSSRAVDGEGLQVLQWLECQGWSGLLVEISTQPIQKNHRKGGRGSYNHRKKRDLCGLTSLNRDI